MEEAFRIAMQVITTVSGMPQLHAVLAGLFAGVAGSYAVSNFMPPNTNTAQAKRITALVSGGVTLIVALLISTTVLTLAWALTMAMVAPAVHGALVRLLIRRWPWAAPASVLDCAEVKMVEESKTEKAAQ
jgi:hypothetical protein